MDFAFVTAAVVVCPGWDLRLAWTSRRAPGAATVSPINDASGSTRLGARGWDLTGLDSACYRNSLFANPEIPRFLESCVYVNHRALADTETEAMADFAVRSAQLRWRHVLADHIYTGPQSATSPEPARRTETPLALQVLREQILRDAPFEPFNPADRA